MRQIKNFPGYFITETGDIFSCKRKKPRKLKSRVDTSTYRRIMLIDATGKGKTLLVHRLVAQTFLENPEDLPCVNHKDGDKENNTVSNLEWCTHSHNNLHAYATGLKTNAGIKNPKNKLEEDDVRRIYISLLDGRSIKDLAAEWGVSSSTIFCIKTRRNWEDLLKDYPPAPVQKRSERLSDNTVHWVCRLLAEGDTSQQIKDKSRNKNLTVFQIKDIYKRRRYETISKHYVW